jgi:hypothetical protein
MNKRIDELAHGCYEYIEGTLDGDIIEFDYKKFAELIARDFAHYVDLMYGCPHGDFYAIEYVDSYFKENTNERD